MLEELKFVKGAVAKKDFSPELTHFRIENSRITGYNGMMAISAPIGLDIHAYPHATNMVRAIEACSSEVSLSMTDGGRLFIKSGKFRAYVECLEKAYFKISPVGDFIKPDVELLPAFSALYDVISDDASRPWAMGLLLNGASAFATNNVVLIERWIGSSFPTLNIPRLAIKEVLRIGKEPSLIQTDGNSVTFHYENDCWLRTQLYDAQWPLEMVEKLLSMEQETFPVPEGFFDAVETLIPFVGDKSTALFLLGNKLSTSMGEKEGVSVELEGLPEGVFKFGSHQLRLLRNLATRINLGAFPEPSLFFGDKLRGALLGMNL